MGQAFHWHGLALSDTNALALAKSEFYRMTVIGL